MSRLKELLPDAPQWFWDCELCSRDVEYCHAHVEAWREMVQQRPGFLESGPEKTLWDICAHFFQYYHFANSHTQYKAEPVEQYEKRQRKELANKEHLRRKFASEPQVESETSVIALEGAQDDPESSQRQSEGGSSDQPEAPGQGMPTESPPAPEAS